MEWLRFSEKQASGMQEANAVRMFQRLGTALIRNPVVEAGTREPGPDRLREEIEPVLSDSGVRWAYLGKGGQVWGSPGAAECKGLAAGWESLTGPDAHRWVACGEEVVLA